MAAMACAAARGILCSYGCFKTFLLLEVEGKPLKLLVLCPVGLSLKRLLEWR